ncbi:uncharacterized protein L201_001238 [Kwoniella dendrophila CBS 6074]|uniref:Uncharacterized protein n=1 Tax=Kwoniella dendrophila CBS 6074 TaxID=1295534 RepID=A0AAX4JNC3_9TREE
MMYTPTPATRRPKPPRSLSRQRPSLVSSKSAPVKSSSTPSTSGVDDKLQAEETPLSSYIRERQEDARNNLSRISASPADVSFSLDIASSTSGTNITAASVHDNASAALNAQNPKPSGVGLGILTLKQNTINNDNSETSPPPPYGQTLLNSSRQHVDSDLSSAKPSTPPHQSLATSSRRPLTSPVSDNRYRIQRQRSTTEGGELATGPSERLILSKQGAGEMSEDNDSLSRRDVYTRLRELEDLLQRREEELIVAARVAEEALKSHEQVMAILPNQVKLRFPHIQDIHSPFNHALPESPFTHNVNQFPMRIPQAELTTTQDFSPIDNYPSTTSTHHRRTPSFLSPHFPQYALESPLTIPSPERYTRNSVRSYGDTRSINRSTSFSIHQNKTRPTIFGAHSSIPVQHPTPRYTRLAALHAEAEDRIIILEQALAEAREGEDNQRKAAARWRKEVDKMQRELSKVDERREKSEQDALRESVIGQAGVRRKSQERETQADPIIEINAKSHLGGTGSVGWGYTAFPEFVTGGFTRSSHQQVSEDPSLTADLLDTSELLNHLDQNQQQDQDEGREVEQSPRAILTIPMDELDSISSTSIGREGSTAAPSQGSLGDKYLVGLGKTLKNKSPSTKHLSPRKVSFRRASGSGTTNHSPHKRTPRVTIESPHISPSAKPSSRRGSKDSSQSGTSIPRSPWPSKDSLVVDVSPEVRRTIDFNSHSRETSCSPSTSPAFASLNSRIENMRSQIERSLSVEPGMGLGRTLGSELGSEFGDDWDKGFRSLENIQWQQNEASSPSPPSRSKVNVNASISHGTHHDDNDDEPDQLVDDDMSFISPIYQPAYPLPPTVSAALSSLAIALAPSTIFTDQPESSSRVKPVKLGPATVSSHVILPTVSGADKIKWVQEEEGSEDISDLALSDETSIKTSNTTSMTAFTLGKQPILSSSKHHGKYPVKRAIAFSVSAKDTPRKYALAHRRMNSSNYQARHLSQKQSLDFKGKQKVQECALLEMKPDQTLTKRGIRKLRPAIKSAARQEEIKQEVENKEPSTIPARIVHDVFCLVTIWLEYLEWFIILAIRICIDIRSGPRGPSGLRQGPRPRRYYI